MGIKRNTTQIGIGLEVIEKQTVFALLTIISPFKSVISQQHV